MLPVGFHFTQANLQDYLDCPRRFQLRYLQSQAWPGVEAEPFLEHEHYLERGAEFHRLIQRHQLGIDVALVDAHIDDPEMRRWWESYLAFDGLHRIEGQRFPELLVSAELGGYRFLGIFDLLLDVTDGRVMIFDWKTYRKMPSRRWLAARAQTRLYLPLVLLASERLLGRVVSPEQVSMLYWCVSAPAEPVEFVYSPALFERDQALLLDLAHRVDSEVVGEWPLVVDVQVCKFCAFRSLCGRGDVAGDVLEWSNMWDNIARLNGEFVLGDVDEVGF